MNAKNQGVNPTNAVAKDINNGVRRSRPSVTTMGNAWRKHLEENPDALKTQSFGEWKKKFLSKWYKEKKKKKKKG
jgi:hypothetical protein